MYAVAALRRHPVLVLILSALAGAILVNAAVQHDLGRAALYLVVVALSVVAIDLTLARWPRQPFVIPVRSPRAEIGLLAASLAVEAGWLYAHFVLDYHPRSGPGRLLWLAIAIGCVFYALPAVVLLARRYRLRELGFRIAGLPAVPMVIAIFAAAALLLSPATITVRPALEESGSIPALVAMGLLAAVPEEFFRFVWQTRIGAWRGGAVAAWLLASTLWAMLHMPKVWSESHSLAGAAMGAVNIIPLGLLWGYLTYRTRSILPAIALHATNLWGLQNLR